MGELGELAVGSEHGSASDVGGEPGATNWWMNTVQLTLRSTSIMITTSQTHRQCARLFAHPIGGLFNI